MVTPRISRHIPINEAHLAYINSNTDATKGIKNTHPGSGDYGETFVSMTVNHRNKGESPRTKVYECIHKFYEYLHKADPTATIYPLYDKEEDDGHKFVPITKKRMLTSLSQLLTLLLSPSICLVFTITYISASCTS
jgi:hypothetical protein